MAEKCNHCMVEVDLASRECRVQPLEEKILRDNIGGLGLGMKRKDIARLLRRKSSPLQNTENRIYG